MLVIELLDSAGIDINDTVPAYDVEKLRDACRKLKMGIDEDLALREKIMEVITAGGKDGAPVRRIAIKLSLKQKTVRPIIERMREIGLVDYYINRHTRITYWKAK